MQPKSFSQVKAMAKDMAQKKMNNRGMAGVSKALLSLLMMVIIAQLIVAFGPTMFEGLTNITGAPSWVGIVAPILVGAFLIFVLWAVVSKVAK